MQNPLRSEAEMFRLVVIIGLGCIAVIAVALLTEPVYGGLLLVAEIGVGAGFLWRQLRGQAPPRRVEVAKGDDGRHRILVVANETVTGKALIDEILDRCEGRTAEIFVIVPALTSSRLEHIASDVDRAIGEAAKRLERSLKMLSEAGLDAGGRVGDHYDPNAAIEDALREFPADEVIISTHPPERSRWLELDVVERARRELPVPVTHVVVDLEAERSRA